MTRFVDAAELVRTLQRGQPLWVMMALDFTVVMAAQSDSSIPVFVCIDEAASADESNAANGCG